MVKKTDLETILHFDEVRDLGRLYDEARTNGGLVPGDNVIKTPDHILRVNLINKMYADNPGRVASARHDSPEEISNKYNAYVRIGAGDNGKKAEKEFKDHKDEIIDKYVKIFDGATKKAIGKNTINDNLKAQVYHLIGKELRKLAKKVSSKQLKDMNDTGTDEEKAVLGALTVSYDGKDLGPYRKKLQEDYAKETGDAPYGLNVPDSVADSARLAEIDMAMRQTGKYFLTEDLKLDKAKIVRFFDKSPYSIAEMTKLKGVLSE